MFCLVAASRGRGGRERRRLGCARMEIRRRNHPRQTSAVGCLRAALHFLSSLPRNACICLYIQPPPPSRVTPHYAGGASLVGGRRRDHRRGNKEPSDRRSSNLSARHERFGSSRTKLSPSPVTFSCVYLASGRWRERGGRESRDITIVFEHQ